MSSDNVSSVSSNVFESPSQTPSTAPSSEVPSLLSSSSTPTPATPDVVSTSEDTTGDRLVVSSSNSTSATGSVTPSRASVSGDSIGMGLCASSADHESPDVTQAAATKTPATPRKDATDFVDARRPSLTSPTGLVAQAVHKAEDTQTKPASSPSGSGAPPPVATGASGGLVAARLRAQQQAEKEAEAAAALASRRPTSANRATTIGTPSPKCPICHQPAYKLESIEFAKHSFHQTPCFKCATCKRDLTSSEALWEDNKLWCPKCKRDVGIANIDRAGVVKSEMSAASLDTLTKLHSPSATASDNKLTTSKSGNDDESLITFSFDDDSAAVNPIQAEEERQRLEAQQQARRQAAAKELEEEEAAAARAATATTGTSVKSPTTPTPISPPVVGGETNLQRQRRLLAERSEQETRERQATAAAALRADQAASLSAKSVAKEQMAAREKEQQDREAKEAAARDKAKLRQSDREKEAERAREQQREREIAALKEREKAEAELDAARKAGTLNTSVAPEVAAAVLKPSVTSPAPPTPTSGRRGSNASFASGDPSSPPATVIISPPSGARRPSMDPNGASSGGGDRLRALAEAYVNSASSDALALQNQALLKEQRLRTMTVLSAEEKKKTTEVIAHVVANRKKKDEIFGNDEEGGSESFLAPGEAAPTGDDDEDKLPPNQFSINNTMAFVRMAAEKLPEKYRELCQSFNQPKTAHIDTFSATYASLDDKFAEELAEMLETNTTLTEVNIESNNITGPGFFALARALKVNKTLTSIRLRNQKVDPSPESLDALLEALEHNTHITNLGWTFGRLAMEDQARRFLDRNFDLLRQKRLQVRRETGGPVKLTPLQLRIQSFVEDKNEGNVMELKFFAQAFMALRLDEKIPLARSLATNTRVQTVYLVGLQLPNDFAVAMAEAVTNNPYVTSIDLTSNCITSPGVEAFAACLRTNDTIRELKLLSQTPATVSRAAEQALADACAVNKTIHRIALEYNDSRARDMVEKACMANKFRKRTSLSGATGSAAQGSSLLSPPSGGSTPSSPAGGLNNSFGASPSGSASPGTVSSPWGAMLKPVAAADHNRSRSATTAPGGFSSPISTTGMSLRSPGPTTPTGSQAGSPNPFPTPVVSTPPVSGEPIVGTLPEMEIAATRASTGSIGSTTAFRRAKMSARRATQAKKAFRPMAVSASLAAPLNLGIMEEPADDAAAEAMMNNMANKTTSTTSGPPTVSEESEAVISFVVEEDGLPE